jgi:mRNA-degrading endonuclease RelE of RelBE toxin-antitoxin system
MGARVVMSDLFGRSYTDLDGQIKNRVLDFIVKLQERPDTPGLNMKTPAGVDDHRIKTARVSDFWRAVLIELPDSLGHILVAVKPHDDAYEFAERLQVGVNEVTGALEVIDKAALDAAVTQAGPARPGTESTPVLGGVRARDLTRISTQFFRP